MKWRRMVELTVGVGMVLGLACSLTASVPSTRLRRYVSDPLPDGQRYTFLYPDRMHLARDPRPIPGSLLFLKRDLSRWSALTDRAVWTDLATHGDTVGEAIYLNAFPIRPKDQTRSWGEAQPGLFWGYYALRRSQADGRRQKFNFSYEWSQSQDRWCRPVSDQIVDSFRILAPGEAPPVDAAPPVVSTSKERSGAGNALAGR